MVHLGSHQLLIGVMRYFVFQGARILDAIHCEAELILWILECSLVTSWNDTTVLRGIVKIFSSVWNIEDDVTWNKQNDTMKEQTNPEWGIRTLLVLVSSKS